MAKKKNGRHNLFDTSDLFIFIVIIYLTTAIEADAVGQGANKINSTAQLSSKDSNRTTKPIKTAVDIRKLVTNAPARINQLPKSISINELDDIKKRKLRRELERGQEQDADEYSTVVVEPSSSPEQPNYQEMNPVSDPDYPQELAGSASTEENTIEGTNSNPNETAIYPSNLGATNNDVEKLVRTQVDLAATNWATFAPNEYLPHLNIHPDSSQASGWHDQNVTQNHHAFSNHRMEGSQRNRFYPNHNYKHDPNASNPFRQHNPHNDYMGKSLISQEPNLSLDPMTTLPDSSNRFGSFQDSGDSYNQYERATTPAIDLSKVTQNHHHQLRYMYRLRGPMTATAASQPELARPTLKPMVLSRSHPTLAQNILRTFERLDGIRSSQDRFDTVPSTSRVDLTKVMHKTPNDESESSSIATPVHNLFSNLPGVATDHSELYGGKISSKGFMDGPMLSASEEGQKNAGSNKNARLHEHDSKNNIQSASESGKGNIEDKLAAISIDYNRRPSIHLKTQATENERAKNGLHARAYKIGQTNVGTSATQRSTLPSPVNKNLNGSLAARLNANRYKNKQPTISTGQTPSPVSSSGSLFYTPAEPLTIDFKKLHNPSRKLMFGSTTLPNPSDTVKPSATSSTAALQMEIPIQRGSVLIRNDPPVKPTTAMLPTSTYPTVAPNLAPALYAAAINSANSNKSNNSNSAASSASYAARPAHHHHLHSHVHSIKPAVISIPIPIQPKFGAYESMLAAAAAAAAAASAGATRTRLARKPFMVQPMQPSVPRLQATRPVPRKIFPIPIPIGGTLASTRTAIPKMMPDQGTLASYQNPSILTNLLDSANKALKQVTGNTASLLSLQMNHPESVISKKAALVYPHLYTKQREGSGDFLGLPMYSASQEHDSFENPMESIGLYQAPITLNSDSSPVYSYLEDLLSAVPPEDYLSNQTSQYEAIVPILTESQRLKSQPFAHQQQHPQQNVIDWDSNTTLHSVNDADNVIFASLGGNPNLLYPMMSQDKAGSNGDQFLVNGAPMSDQSSNMMNAFEVPLWDKRRPQAQQMDSSLPGRGYKKALSKGNSMKEQSPKTKGRNNYLDGSSGHSNRPPYSSDKHRPSFASSHQFETPMQYALSHYAQDQAAYSQDNQQNNLIYDVFDDKNNKFSYPQGVEYFATPETMDGFRPISHPSYYYSTPNASSFLDAFHNQVGLKSNPPNMVNSNHQPVVHAHHNDAQASQEKAKKVNGAKFGSQRDPGQALSHTGHQGLKELYQHSNLEQPTTLIQFLPHNIYPTELMHHAMANAGSSIKPHIVAANELINYHKQHLIDHHLLHHHYRPNSGSHQDMATSESARLAVSSPIRGSLLTHFMPLALAMIPIMVVVAMLAQLVMTAPLIMFAMTTLAVSRLSGALFGPLSAREEPFGIDSILSGHNLINNTLAKLKTTGEAASGSASNNTSGHTQRRRRKRDLKVQNAWLQDESKQLIEFRNHFRVPNIRL